MVFFVISPGLGRMEVGGDVDCRVISYAWNWVPGSRPLNGRNRVLDVSWALYINVIKNVKYRNSQRVPLLSNGTGYVRTLANSLAHSLIYLLTHSIGMSDMPSRICGRDVGSAKGKEIDPFPKLGVIIPIP